MPLARTHFLAVSKSGSTAETLMQLLVVIAALEKASISIAERISVVTEPKPSALRKLAQERGFALLDHPDDIGGRFSVLSIVGLLPAMLAGLSAEKIRAGAASVWRAAKAGDTFAAEGAAFAVAGSEAGKVISVLMPYSDRLDRFAFWYRQLWAESLGKNGKGTLPVRALGPVDQHSQLQLYLDGPNNAVYSVIAEAQKGPRVPPALAPGELAYLGGRTIGDLVAAEARATYETLLAHDRPSRLIETGAIDEEILGALLQHFMLETILTARIDRRRRLRSAGGRGGQDPRQAVPRRHGEGLMAPASLPPVRPIALADIEAARRRIAGTILRTPLVRLQLGRAFPTFASSSRTFSRSMPTSCGAPPMRSRSSARPSASAASGRSAPATPGRASPMPRARRAFRAAWSRSRRAPASKLERMRALGAKLFLVPYETAWKTLDERAFPRRRGHVHPPLRRS